MYVFFNVFTIFLSFSCFDDLASQYGGGVVITFPVYVRKIMGILNPPKINSLILDPSTLELGATARNLILDFLSLKRRMGYYCSLLRHTIWQTKNKLRGLLATRILQKVTRLPHNLLMYFFAISSIVILNKIYLNNRYRSHYKRKSLQILLIS